VDNGDKAISSSFSSQCFIRGYEKGIVKIRLLMEKRLRVNDMHPMDNLITTLSLFLNHMGFFLL